MFNQCQSKQVKAHHKFLLVLVILSGLLVWGCSTNKLPERQSYYAPRPSIGQKVSPVEISTILPQGQVVVKPVVMNVDRSSLQQKLIKHKDYAAIATNYPEFTQLALDLIHEAELETQKKNGISN